MTDDGDDDDADDDWAKKIGTKQRSGSNPLV